jgi:hypothetical protein
MKRGGNTLPALPGGTLYYLQHAILFSFHVSDACRQDEKGGEHPACTISTNCFLLLFTCIVLLKKF